MKTNKRKIEINLSLECQVNSQNIKIINSYLITDKNIMRKILEMIFYYYPEYQSDRTINSFIREWRAHNFFYKIHMWRHRTKDCDLEAQQKWTYKLFYFIFGR